MPYTAETKRQKRPSLGGSASPCHLFLATWTRLSGLFVRIPIGVGMSNPLNDGEVRVSLGIGQRHEPAGDRATGTPPRYLALAFLEHGYLVLRMVMIRIAISSPISIASGTVKA